MGYIQDLRKLIGQRTLILVGACALITDEQGRLLLQLRGDNHHWGFLGGSLEPGETLEEAARREVREETGLELGELTLFGVFSGPECCYQYPNGDSVCDVNVIYLAKPVQGSMRADGEEGLELRYFALEELPPDINPPDIPILRKFRERMAEGSVSPR